jgi:hypothetical protein
VQFLEKLLLALLGIVLSLPLAEFEALLEELHHRNALADRISFEFFFERRWNFKI